MNQNNHTYDDIIELPHPTSKKHPRMAPNARAAQFAPFAALSGHGEAIYETERQVDTRPILSEDRLQILNQKITWLQENIYETPEVRIKYFVPDLRKDGGTLMEKMGTVKKIDPYVQILVFIDQTIVPLANLVEIDSSYFPD